MDTAAPSPCDSNERIPPSNCRVAERTRRPYFQPASDAMPVEVDILHTQSGHVVVVEARHGLPFHLLTNRGYLLTNVSPVRADHIRLL